MKNSKYLASPIGLAMTHNSFLALSGIITALLIINYFSKDLQGLYYTIVSFTPKILNIRVSDRNRNRVQKN